MMNAEDTKKLGMYNSHISTQWSIEATKIEAELVFSISVKTKKSNKPGETFIYWDMQRGTKELIQTLKQVTAELEAKQKNSN